MLFKPKGTEPAVASRARDQARWLIRDHGDEAEAVIRAKLRRPGVLPADLYRYKLTARELKRLRRRDAQPGPFSIAALLRLIGLGGGVRKRRRG